MLAVATHDKKLYVYNIPAFEGAGPPGGEEWTNWSDTPHPTARPMHAFFILIIKP